MNKTLKQNLKILLMSGLLALTEILSPMSAYAMTNATQEIIQSEDNITPNYKVSNNYKLYVNGENKNLQNDFVVVNDRTFLPVREVANLLGVSNDYIDWEQETQVVSLSKDSTLIEIPIGRTRAAVNNEIKDIDLTDTPESPTRSLLTKGVTYLPLGFLGETLNYKVDYQSDTKTIHLFNTDTEKSTGNSLTPIINKTISEEDRLKLDKWKFKPDDELYLKYKGVFDNPKYYNQENGNINWPTNDGFLNEKTDYVLKSGVKIDRYGQDTGIFVSPEGTPYEQRAVAPGTYNRPYSIFEVIEPIDVKAGEIAPWFDEPGGGIQYILPESVEKLLKDGKLKRLEN